MVIMTMTDGDDHYDGDDWQYWWSLYHEKALEHLNDVEDDQRQGGSLLQEQHVKDQPDGEEEEGEAEQHGDADDDNQPY